MIESRGDGYEPSCLMSTEEAESYHAEQIKVYSNTEADLKRILEEAKSAY
jgi:hypothetical protein